MNLPEHVKIGGFWYTIESANDELDLRNLYGRTPSGTLSLQINDSLPPALLKETMLHEILHLCEILLPPDDEMTERQVKIVARIMFQVFTENPEVRKFIFED